MGYQGGCHSKWLLAAALAAAGGAHAQTEATRFPCKSIRLLVPFAPGGPVDIIARAVSPRMSDFLGQMLVVDNRGGGGSVIGTEIVANAPADGYTLAMVSGSLTINPAMVKKLPYDSLKSFAFIAIVADVPSTLVINPGLPAKNLKEFIALAKTKPGELNYSSPGRGTLGHLAGEWFSASAGVKMVHVSYKGAAPALLDVMSGQVQLLFAAIAGTVQLTRDGKVRMLAQGGKSRSASMPEVPTFVEAGLPGYWLSSNFGLIAPAGTPRAVVDRLRGAVVQALADGAVKGRLSGLGAEPVGSTPEEHAAYTRAEIAKWIQVARAAGIQAE